MKSYYIYIENDGISERCTFAYNNFSELFNSHFNNISYSDNVSDLMCDIEDVIKIDLNRGTARSILDSVQTILRDQIEGAMDDKNHKDSYRRAAM